MVQWKHSLVYIAGIKWLGESIQQLLHRLIFVNSSPPQKFTDNNILTGSIPAQMGSMTSLTICDLSKLFMGMQIFPQSKLTSSHFGYASTIQVVINLLILPANQVSVQFESHTSIINVSKATQQMGKGLDVSKYDFMYACMYVSWYFKLIGENSLF